MAAAAVVLTTGVARLRAQGPGGGRSAQALFTALDTDGDGTLTRGEMTAGFESWFTAWGGTSSGTMTRDQVLAGVSKLLPAPPAVRPGQASTFNPKGNSTPIAVPQAGVDAMMAALPETAGAKPVRARKVLVMAHTGAGGFVHASIPMAAKTIEALGNKGSLWTTTISYDAADINTNNLKQYDAIFLDSTTACFLDDADASVTTARRAAFMDFVRSGKGVAGIHAATDSYHTDCTASEKAANSPTTAPNMGAAMLGGQLIGAADKDHSGTVSHQEWSALAADLFAKLDTSSAGKVIQGGFRCALQLAAACRGGAAACERGVEAGAAMARVQHSDRRIFQVSLVGSAVDHGQDRRSEEPAYGHVPRQRVRDPR